MPRQIVTTEGAPASPFYSQGVKAGPFVFISGTVGADPATGTLGCHERGRLGSAISNGSATVPDVGQALGS